MPERPLTQEEIEWAKSQGLDPKNLVAQEGSDDKMGAGEAVAKSLRQKAGGIVGAGVGALGAPALVGAAIGGPVGLLSGIALGVGGALTGGYVGQKGQEALEGEETAKRYEEEAAQARTEHPYIVPVADLAAGALASGGSLSPKTAVSGVKGIIGKVLGREITKDAAQDAANVAIQSTLMPAINTGVNYASTGELPSAGQLAFDAAGGALFAKPSRLGEWAGRPRHKGEPAPEISKSTTEQDILPPVETVKSTVESAFTAKVNEQYKIDDNNVKKLFLDQFAKRVVKINPAMVDADRSAAQIANAEARTFNAQLRKMPINEMRQKLHDDFVSKIPPTPVPEPTPEPIKATVETTPKPIAKVEEVLPQQELTPEQLALKAEGEADAAKPVPNIPLEPPINKDTVAKSATPPEALPVQTELPIDTSTTLPPHIKLAEGESYRGNVGEMHARIAGLKDNAWSDVAKGLNIDEKSRQTPIIISDKRANDFGASHYDPDADVIVLHSSHKDNIPVIMHEMAHASVIRSMPVELHELRGSNLKAYIDNYLVKGQSESVKELLRCYVATAEHLRMTDALFNDATDILHNGLAGQPDKAQESNIPHAYQMSKPTEFASGVFDSAPFRQKLSEIPSGLAPGQSMLTRIYQALKKFLAGNVKDDSMLERVLRPINEISGKARIEDWDYRGRGVAKSSAPIDPIPERLKKEGTSFIPGFRARADAIAARHDTPAGHLVTGQAHKFLGYFDYLTGKFSNKALDIVAKSGLTPGQITKTYQYNHEMSLFGASKIKLSPEEMTLSKSIQQHTRDIGKIVQEEGPKVKLENGNLRMMKLKEEGYMPSVISQDVVYEWAQNPGSAKAKSFDRAYMEHQLKQGEAREDAAKMLFDYKNALGNPHEKGATFQAIRKAEGNGLPWEIVDQNLSSALSRYGKRAARDVSFFKHLQSIPEVRKALDIDDQTGHRMGPEDLPNIEPLGNSDQVKALKRSIYGIDDNIRSPVFYAFARAAGNTVMGPGTALRNVATIPGIMATYVQGKQMGLAVKALYHMNESKARALSSNAARPNFQESFDLAGYRRDDPNPIVNLLNKYSSFMRKWQGRDLSDKFEGEYYYALGELLTTDNIARAQNGNAESKRFIQRFGDIVDGGPARLLSGKVTPEDVSRVAKRFVDATRGTYSAEGLPSWVLEGPLAPFAALSKFSIEKSNTVWKDVIEPAKKGMYGPLIRYTLGSLGVGVAIEKMNELLSNKRGPDPTVNEALDGLTPEIGLAKAISLFQLGSFAGTVSDGAKLAMQMYQGKELRYNQPLSLPLYTLVTDTIMGNVKDAVAAMNEGQDPFQVMGMLATTLGGQSVQTLRYMDANFWHPEEAKRKEKFRDISTFQQMEGQRSGPIIKSNPFLDSDAKTFKRTGDVEEAMKLLPGLIQEAIEKSKGDPYVLQRKLRSLKQNSYQTVPSLERMPISYLRYINRLKNTQGEAVANARLEDYIRQNAINKAKAEAVP